MAVGAEVILISVIPLSFFFFSVVLTPMTLDR